VARILVVYYSRTGNTKKMAEAVAEGAKSAGGDVTLAPVDKVKAGDLVKYDGLILGSPTYYGLMAAEVKKLLDESVSLHGELEGRAGGAFSSSANPGGGNETTVLSILQALLIHGMVVQGTHSGDHYGPIAVGAPDARALGQCHELGERVARLASACGREG